MVRVVTGVGVRVEWLTTSTDIYTQIFKLGLVAPYNILFHCCCADIFLSGTDSSAHRLKEYYTKLPLAV